MTRVSPGDAAYFTDREKDFEKRILEATMGQDLVGILTPATAFDLLKTDKLFDFIGRTKYQGKPLADRLGGWLKQGEVFRGREMACYHKEWAYFSNRFKVTCATFIEAKPGIPPTPKHVEEVIALDEGAEDPRALRVELFQPQPDRRSGGQDRRQGGDRAGEHPWSARASRPTSIS